MGKAQVQAISMVLMAGVVLALVGTAYMWGMPLIEKRTTATDVSTAESFILELDRQIVDIARNGGGKSVVIPGIAGASVKVNQSGNEIFFRFIASQAMLGMGEDSASIPIETYDMEPVGSYGGSPRIITLEGEPVDSGQYLMTLRLKYRSLETQNDPLKGYMIVVKDGGNLAGGGASSRINIAYIGSTTQSNGCCSNNGDRIDTLINVTIS